MKFHSNATPFTISCKVMLHFTQMPIHFSYVFKHLFIGINPERRMKASWRIVVFKKTDELVQKKILTVNPHVTTLLKNFKLIRSPFLFQMFFFILQSHFSFSLFL